MSDNPYKSPHNMEGRGRIHLPTKDELLIIAGLLLVLAIVTGPYIGYAMFGGYRGSKETYLEMQQPPPQQFEGTVGDGIHT